MTSSDQLATSITRVADFVSGWHRPSAIIGGMAMIARVRARPTADVDLVVAVEEGETDQLLAHARACGFQYDEAETRVLLEGGLVRLFGPTGEPGELGLDLLFVDGPFLEEVAARAEYVEIEGQRLPFATLEDLVLLKLAANRPIDIDDILAIRDAFGGELDYDYLQVGAQNIGVTKLFELYFSPLC